jgi:predicted DNA binding CopG/RHH family protein
MPSKRKQVNIRLPEPTIVQLKDLSSRLGVSESQVVIMALALLSAGAQTTKAA